MATTKNYYTGNGTTTAFTFTFPYLNTNHIKVKLDGVVLATTEYTLTPTSNPTTVNFNTAPTNLAQIEIYRETSLTTANNVFAAGSSVKAASLNDNQTQALYALEEQENSIERGEIFKYANANHSAGATAPTTPSSGDTWFDSTSGRTYIYYVDTDSSQWVEANPPFDSDGDRTFTQSSSGGVARTWNSKLNELISVKDFGAVGDGSTDDTTAIKNAIAAGDGVNIVYFPAGTYIVKEPIIIPSNSYIKGAGGAYTSIKMDSSIGRLTGLGVIGTWDTTTENVLVEDITFDFNTARWHGYSASPSSSTSPKIETNNHTAIYSNVKTGTYSRSGSTVTVTITNHGFEIGEAVNVDCTTGGGTDEEKTIATVADANTFTYTSGSSGTVSGNCSVKAVVNGANRNALTIYNSNHITLNRVRCLHGQRHSLDITSPYRRGSTGTTSDTSYYDTATTYMHKGAQYVTVNDCYFTGAGDDNLTTHFSSNILITNCLSESPRGGFSTGTNTNCFEIDDGSRNVQLYNCRAYKGNQGLEIKGHGYAPAPYNILVDGLEIINCVGGVEAHHSNWKTQTDDASAWKANSGTTSTAIPSALVAAYTSGQLTSLSDNGHSATANNLTLNNIQIIAPCNQTFKKKGSSGEDTDASESTPQRCFEIGAYNGVQINNLLCSDGTRDRNLSADGYENTDTLSNHKVVIVHNSARNVQINNLTINGFYDTAEIGLKIDDLVNEGITINNFNVIDGPLQALYAEAPAAANTGPVYIGSLDNYNIYQTRTVGTSTGSDTADGTAWTSLTAALQYAINFQPSQFHVGSGTIKGYNTDQGVRPLEYLPLIWGSDHDSTTSIRTMDTGDIDDTKYILNGNVCTVFMKQANLKLASTAATGTLRIMLPFRPLEAGFPAAVYSDRLDLANTYATITTNVVNEYVYSNSTTKKGYIHLKGVRDNNTAENIDCSEIEANASSNATDIIFNLTYIIDESADPNF